VCAEAGSGPGTYIQCNACTRVHARARARRPFDYVMLVVILFNCAIMAMEGPYVEDGSRMAALLRWSDVACTGVFVVEAGIKVSDGAPHGPPFSQCRHGSACRCKRDSQT
jgi:hypothetical protein